MAFTGNFTLTKWPMTFAIDTDLAQQAKSWWEEVNASLEVPYIDTQHLWLLSLILRLEKISHLELPEQLSREFRETLTELICYADQHFKAEEAAFAALKYPAEAEHKKQHSAFVTSLHRLSRSAINRQTARTLHRYLRQWLTTHILKEDRHYAQFFARRKIDLNEFFKQYSQEENKTLSEHEKAFYREILGERHHLVEENKLVLEKTAELWESLRLRIGVPVIDIQHLWLIKMTVELEYALRKTGAEKKQVFALCLQEAFRYVQEHFAAEEVLMEALGYPDLEKHRASHATFVKTIEERQLDFTSKKDIFFVNLVRDLKEWLFSHIAIADKLIALHARKNHQEAIAVCKELLHTKKVTLSPAQLALYRSIVKQP